jgi:hypothetical protein
MRTFVLIFALLALATSASAGTTKATLRIVDQTPLTVRGTGFHVEQSVRLNVSQSGSTLVRRTVRTGLRGGFTVRLVAPTLQRCGGDVAITARDASGRIAVAKLPMPDCPPPLAP